MGEHEVESFLPLTPAMFHVLLALAGGVTHGYAIMKQVDELSGGEVRLSAGTLYGIIKRLLDSGLIEETAEPLLTRRRSYRLTRLGRRVARAEAERMERVVARARLRRLLPDAGTS